MSKGNMRNLEVSSEMAEQLENIAAEKGIAVTDLIGTFTNWYSSLTEPAAPREVRELCSDLEECITELTISSFLVDLLDNLPDDRGADDFTLTMALSRCVSHLAGHVVDVSMTSHALIDAIKLERAFGGRLVTVQDESGEVSESA